VVFDEHARRRRRCRGARRRGSPSDDEPHLVRAALSHPGSSTLSAAVQPSEPPAYASSSKSSLMPPVLFLLCVTSEVPPRTLAASACVIGRTGSVTTRRFRHTAFFMAAHAITASGIEQGNTARSPRRCRAPSACRGIRDRRDAPLPPSLLFRPDADRRGVVEILGERSHGLARGLRSRSGRPGGRRRRLSPRAPRPGGAASRRARRRTPGSAGAS
jgi:hypothetical protein